MKSIERFTPSFRNFMLSSHMFNSISDLYVDNNNICNRLTVSQSNLLNAFDSDDSSRILVTKNYRNVGLSLMLAVYAYHYARSHSAQKIAVLSNNSVNMMRLYDLIAHFARGNVRKSIGSLQLSNGTDIVFGSDESPLTLSGRKELTLALIENSVHMQNMTSNINNLLMVMQPRGRIVCEDWPAFNFRGWRHEYLGNVS